MNKVHLHLTKSIQGDGGTRLTRQACSKPRNTPYLKVPAAYLDFFLE